MTKCIPVYQAFQMPDFIWCTTIYAKVIRSCGIKIYKISTIIIIRPIEIHIAIIIYILNMFLVIIK